MLLTAAEARGTAADLVEVRAMSEEHADIDPLVTAIGDGFAALVEHPCDEHRNALDIRLAGLREVLDEHLRHEETVVLPMVQRVMTAEQYEAVEKAIGTSYPVREVPFIVGWAMHGLPDDGPRGDVRPRRRAVPGAARPRASPFRAGRGAGLPLRRPWHPALSPEPEAGATPRTGSRHAAAGP